MDDIKESENRMEEDFAAMLEASFKPVYNGDVVTGKILSVTPDWLVVDIGSYMDGIVLKEELLYDGETMADFQPEMTLTLRVKRVDTREGQIYLSRKEADKITVWSELEQLRQAETPVELKVLQAVKGGLRVTYKGQVQGFVPASQAADHYIEDLTGMVGETLRCLILEVKEEKKEFTASCRRVLEQEKKAARDRVFASLKAGAKLTGTVVRLADFGAFVEIEPGVDGLIPLRDLSWSRVKHPSELLRVGDRVQVAVQEVDAARERISLSLKAMNPDPWESLPLSVGEYREGCRVNHLIPGGAFVTVAEGIEGFLPISQISDQRIRAIEDVLQEGQEITVRIVKIDPAARKISLSMKEVSQEAGTLAEENHYTEEDEAATSLGSLLQGLKL